jgi:4,5-dihydroxyphthalate decarboxylase
VTSPIAACHAAAGAANRQLTFALARYPHTKRLLDDGVHLEGAELEGVEVNPIHRAFAPMVRELQFDFAELALATVLQAAEAGVPILPLPVVLHGNFHHRSIWSLAAPDHQLRPDELRGRKVAIRSYSQTTGLWLRSVLAELYGVTASAVTWVTSEGPHVAQAVDPDNVVHSTMPLMEALRAGQVDAIVMGPRAANGMPELSPLVTDWRPLQDAFYEQHGWVPINHLAVVRRDLLEKRPDIVRGVYEQLGAGIRSTQQDREVGPLAGRSVQCGVSESLMVAVDFAIEKAREQRLISSDLCAADLFRDIRDCLGE